MAKQAKESKRESSLANSNSIQNDIVYKSCSTNDIFGTIL